MDQYKCSICGYVFDEEKEGTIFSELKICPICKQPERVFEKIETREKTPVIQDGGSHTSW